MLISFSLDSLPMAFRLCCNLCFFFSLILLFFFGAYLWLIAFSLQAALRQLAKNKVPNMAVVLKSITHTHADAKAVFRDPTGTNN